MFPRRLRPGQVLTAKEQNEMMRKLAMTRQSGTGTSTVVQENGTAIVRDNAIKTIFARITGSPSGAKYPFIEVVRNDDGTYTDDTNWYQFGTTTATPAVELTGNTGVPTNAIVELSVLPGGDAWGFTYGAGGVSTENVDGTDQDTTTTDIRANQATGIEFTTTGGYQRLDINVPVLTDLVEDELTFNVSAENLVCVTALISKTYASTLLGGQAVLTDVTVTLYGSYRTDTHLIGTVIGTPATCEPLGDCCPDVCPDGVTYTTATVSSKTLDCTCLPDNLIYGGIPGGGVLARWSTASCPGNVSWDLECLNGTTYRLMVGGVAATSVSQSFGTLVFDSPNLGANCGGAGGTARITITP